MKRWALLCGVMLLFAGIASAQDDRVEVFGGYSYVNADSNLFGTNDRVGFNGGSGSIAYKVFPMVSVVADFGGYHWSGSGDTAGEDATAISYMFGPKVSTHVGPVQPFAQALFGATHISGTICGEGCASGSDNSFSMAIGGGVDWNATPHIGVRVVQAEYYYTNFNDFNFNQHQNNLRVSAGVTFRF